MPNKILDNYSTYNQQPEQELLDLVIQWQKSATHTQRMNILRKITTYYKYSNQEQEKISVREMAQTIDILLAKYPGILKITS